MTTCGWRLLDIAKHRNGPTGEVRLDFDGRYTRFENRIEGVDSGGDAMRIRMGQGKRWIWVACGRDAGWATVLAVRAVTIRDIRVAPVGEVPVSAEQVLAQVSAKVGQELDRAALSEDIRALQRSRRLFLCGGPAGIRGGRRHGPVVPGGGPAEDPHPDRDGRGLYRQQESADADGDRLRRPGGQCLAGREGPDGPGTLPQGIFPRGEGDLDLQARSPASPEFMDVAIQVEEGRRAVVRRILFPGNRQVPRKQLLQAMTQKQSSWLRWMNNAGIYEPGSLLADREALRKVFMDQGYLGAVVGEPTFTYVSRKKIDITFTCHARPGLHAGRLADRRADAVPEQRGVARGGGAVRRNAPRWRPSSAARATSGISTDRAAISRPTVDPRVALDTNAATAAVSYQVREGTLAYIQNIEIRGNAQTKDKVIRREINVAPGDIYNEVKIRSSENRVRNLNYFSYVNTYPESTVVSNRYNLIFDVEEQRTGQFMVGAGISSVDNIIGFVELTQGNFDLFGWPHFSGRRAEVEAAPAGRQRAHGFGTVADRTVVPEPAAVAGAGPVPARRAVLQR